MTLTLAVNGHPAPVSQHDLPPLSQQPTPSSSTGTVKVLIVGGGPAGLVCLRNFVEDDSQQPGGKKGLDAVLYERREEVGGVWYLDPNTLSIEEKQGYPSNRWPIASATHPLYPSPSYPSLIGNVFHRFLTFSGQPFEQPADQFPTLEETYRYLQAVAQPLRRHIRLKRDVKQVWELPYLPSQDDNLPRSGGWLVHTSDLSTNPPTDLYEHFSALSFCPSFTTHPSYPDIPGLATAMRLAPSKIHHAKWYRTVEPFWKSKRVVVVGNGLSSNDIAAQIVARRRQEYGEDLIEGEEKVLRALRHDYVEMFPSLPDVRYRDVPFITSVDVRPSTSAEEPSLNITLASGEVVTDVDHLIWGTGYQVGVYDWVNVLARQPTQSDIAALGEAGITSEKDNGWKVDADLKVGSLDTLFKSLESLWVRLTPPPKYPTEDKIKSALARAPTVTSYSSQREELDVVFPTRVPHLHTHIFNARNPTLAFGALNISAVPFVLADLVSRYIRLAWEADAAAGQGYVIPTTFEERRKDELARFELLQKTKTELDAATAEALTGSELDDTRITITKDVTTVNGGKLPSLPPSGLLSFHILRDTEFPWQCRLRETILRFKPWLRNLDGLRDDEWTEEREVERKSMYGAKKVWLEERREQERLRNHTHKINGSH